MRNTARPRTVKYPNQEPKKRLKGERLSLYIRKESGGCLEALAGYRNTSKTEIIEALLAYEHARLVMEGKIKTEE
jgi:hypothetical protein